ncbi:MAG: hypothetical protein QM539_08195 [Alphaproteobacteria bacterium]|nr:hypothetical protein [Alphaproteobacteria bacterium]
MQKFRLKIIEPRIKIWTIQKLLIMMSTFLLGALWYEQYEINPKFEIKEILILVVCLFNMYIFVMKLYQQNRPMVGFFCLQVTAFVFIGQLYIAMCFIVMFFLFTYLNAPFYIYLDQDGILIKKFFATHKKWQALNQVIIKDGRLVLDYKNNKINYYQIDILPTEAQLINQFSQENISKI